MKQTFTITVESENGITADTLHSIVASAPDLFDKSVSKVTCKDGINAVFRPGKDVLDFVKDYGYEINSYYDNEPVPPLLAVVCSDPVCEAETVVVYPYIGPNDGTWYFGDGVTDWLAEEINGFIPLSELNIKIGE